MASNADNNKSRKVSAEYPATIVLDNCFKEQEMCMNE